VVVDFELLLVFLYFFVDGNVLRVRLLVYFMICENGLVSCSIFFCVSFKFKENLSESIDGLHVASVEEFVFEVDVIFLFYYFRHLAELVHVELPDKGGEVFMSEVLRQYFFLKLLGVLDHNLFITMPGQILFVLFHLRLIKGTSRIW
jgi:hypothetical protein